MKYTKEQLEKMSDDEVELALAKKFGRTLISTSDDGFSDMEFSDIDMNNWNDIMPLAVEHGISLLKRHDDWCALLNKPLGVDIYLCDKSPQRAIACCLLMMEIGK